MPYAVRQAADEIKFLHPDSGKVVTVFWHKALQEVGERQAEVDIVYDQPTDFLQFKYA